MNEFKRFEDRLTGLIEFRCHHRRRRLSAEIMKRLRQSQQRSVMAQKAPDGTPARHASSRAPEKRPVALSEKCLRNHHQQLTAPARNRHQRVRWRKSPKIAWCASVRSVGRNPERREGGLIIRARLCSALPVRMRR